MLKFITFAIFTIAILKGSSIWEKFMEYKRSENEHEINRLMLMSMTNAEMMKTMLDDMTLNKPFN